MALASATSLMIGPANSILQNIVYAMPARAVRVHSLAAVEISVDGSAWDALTNAETTGADAGSGYLRCTTGNTTVLCKAY
jgi:hypothetical protein